MKPPPRADPILLLLPALGLLGFVLGPGIVASASGLPAPARGAVLSAEEVAQALGIMATGAPEDLDGALAAREPAAAMPCAERRPSSSCCSISRSPSSTRCPPWERRSIASDSGTSGL